MSEFKLNCCPFCNSNNVRIPHIDGKNQGIIECLNCQCLVQFENRNVTDEQLATLWNRRANKMVIQNNYGAITLNL